MSGTRIHVRADGGGQQGLGHLFRAMSLAEMLLPLQAEASPVHFHTRCDLPGVHGQLRSRGFVPVVMEAEGEDAFLLQLKQGDIVVMDGYHFEEGMQRAVRGKGALLVMIDDLADRHQVADVVVNHAPHFSLPYAAEPCARICTGLEYAILRSEFLEAARKPQAQTREGILLAFGGADPLDLTRKALEGIAQSAYGGTVHVILGAGYAHTNALRQMAAHTQPKVHHNLDAKALAQLLMQVEIAVLPASTMALEAIACGVPWLVSGWFVENQVELHRGLLAAGLIHTVDDMRLLDAKEWGAALAMPSPAEVELMQQRHTTAIDGRSGARLCAIVQTAMHLTCRRAEGKDVDLYFGWANTPSVRASSFHSGEIAYAQHVEWFQRRLADAQSHLFLFHWDGIPCGQVRIQEEGEEAVIGISVDEGFRGRGLSVELLERACTRFFQERQVRVINAYIKYENHASQQAFQRAGFRSAGEGIVNGVGCLRFQRSRK